MKEKDVIGICHKKAVISFSFQLTNMNERKDDIGNTLATLWKVNSNAFSFSSAIKMNERKN